MYTQAVARPRQLRPRHSVENQWDLLAALGIAAPDRTLDSVEMAERSRTSARAWTRGSQRTARCRTRPVVVMHVSAGNPFRRWPVDRFAAVAARLVPDDPSRVVVLTSGPCEAGAADEAAREAQRQLPAGLAIADRALRRVRPRRNCARSIGRAALYIGGDSGPLHIAGTTRTPVVGLYRSDAARALGAVAGSGHSVRGGRAGGPLPCRPCDQRNVCTATSGA